MSPIQKVRAGRLYYGVKTEKHQAYREKFPDWKNNRNVEVVQVFSRQNLPLTLDAGYSGYIQVGEGEGGSCAPSSSAMGGLIQRLCVPAASLR